MSVRPLSATVVLAFAGCAIAPIDLPCASNTDCPASQLCLASGICGDAGQGLVVEIDGTAFGAQAEDFPVASLQSASFQLAAPALIFGSVAQAIPGVGVYSDAGTAALPAYAGAVSFQATGMSTLIPGQLRSSQTSQDLSIRGGVFQLSVGMGIYDFSAVPLDAAKPPLIIHGITVTAGAQISEGMILPYTNEPGFPCLSGQLTSGGSAAPRAYSVQAFASPAANSTSQLGDPLSQPAHVSGADFTLCLALPPQGPYNVLIQASPVVGTVGPSMLFPLDLTPLTAVDGGSPYPGVALDLGSFGIPVTASGQILGVDGLPLSGASVYIAGPVTGGGQFLSSSATTASDGTFSLQTLPSATDLSGNLVLWAIPPVGNPSGIYQGPVQILAGAVVALKAVTCPPRLNLVGSLLNPNGSAAVDAGLKAVVVSAAPGGAHVPPELITQTDENGAFSIYVDPAFYRLDFSAGQGLPRASFFQDLTAGHAPDGGVPAYQLSNGGTLTGSVTATMASGDVTPAQFTPMHFFRLATVDGVRVSYPLGDVTTDVNGNYTVILPVR